MAVADAPRGYWCVLYPPESLHRGYRRGLGVQSGEGLPYLHEAIRRILGEGMVGGTDRVTQGGNLDRLPLVCGTVLPPSLLMYPVSPAQSWPTPSVSETPHLLGKIYLGKSW